MRATPRKRRRGTPVKSLVPPRDGGGPGTQRETRPPPFPPHCPRPNRPYTTMGLLRAYGLLAPPSKSGARGWVVLASLCFDTEVSYGWRRGPNGAQGLPMPPSMKIRVVLTVPFLVAIFDTFFELFFNGALLEF